MASVDFLPGARRDFDESFDWYAARSPAAALHFAKAVDAALANIAASPRQFGPVDGEHWQCPLKRFPFRSVGQLRRNDCRVDRSPVRRRLR
jgi:plasmid stabilization system protein ParE